MNVKRNLINYPVQTIILNSPDTVPYVLYQEMKDTIYKQTVRISELTGDVTITEKTIIAQEKIITRLNEAISIHKDTINKLSIELKRKRN